MDSYADLKTSRLPVCELPERWRTSGQETASADELAAQSFG